MLRIDASTTREQLLDTMIMEARRSGDLYIEIQELPSFLNTNIAFTVFQYQISNYPRNIIWLTANTVVKDFLRQNGIEARVLNDELMLHSKALGATSHSSALVLSDTGDSGQSTKVELPTTFSFNPTDEKKNLSIQELFEKRGYEPSMLIDQAEEDIESDEMDEESLQNLDQWLKKIEATKSALETMRVKTEPLKPSFPQNSRQKILDFFFGSRIAKVMVASLVFSLLMVSFLVLFPTTVYTIGIKPVSVEGGATLEFQESDFRKNISTFRAEKETQASGQKEIPTSRAFGSVSLINGGGRPVQLDNGLFKLQKDGKTYQTITNNTLPRSFTIPAKNNINGPQIIFSIQAESAGDDFNLAENTSLDITNLLGQKVCANCYAVTTTPIKSTQLTGDTVVTEADYSLLKNSVESSLATQRDQEMKSLQNADVITNTSWFKNDDSNYNFSHQIGQTTKTVSLKVSVVSSLYTLPKETVERRIKEQNQSVNRITDLAVVETTGNLGEDGKVSLKTFYTYIKNDACFNRSEAATEFGSKEFESAKSNLIQRCPNVQSVEKQQQGVQMPGLPSRVDVKIVEE